MTDMLKGIIPGYQSKWPANHSTNANMHVQERGVLAFHIMRYHWGMDSNASILDG